MINIFITINNNRQLITILKPRYDPITNVMSGENFSILNNLEKTREFMPNTGPSNFCLWIRFIKSELEDIIDSKSRTK